MAEYVICGNKHNCTVNIKYRIYILIFNRFYDYFNIYLLIIDNIPYNIHNANIIQIV